MATLFERLIGTQPEPDPGINDRKIALHGFIGAINEVRRGKLTQADFVAIYNLSASQEAEADALRQLIIDAPDKMAFLRVFKDWLYLGESRTDARYLVRANLLARLQEEVTDQGGTVT